MVGLADQTTRLRTRAADRDDISLSPIVSNQEGMMVYRMVCIVLLALGVLATLLLALVRLPVSEAQNAPSADLSITKQDGPDPVIAGEPLIYTIFVRNAGPNPAQNVLIRDTLPAGVAFSGTSTITVTNGLTADIEVDGAELTGTVGLLEVGGVVTITGRTQVNRNANGVSLVNTAFVTVTGDITPGNNSASTSTVLVTLTPTPTPTATPNSADLRIIKSAQPNPVIAGQPLTYTIIVYNDGPAAAPNLVIHDQLSAGLVYTGISHIRGPSASTKTLILSENRLTGTVSLLPVGRSITITALTRVNAGASGTTLTNTASVTAANDPTMSNNLVRLVTGLVTLMPTPTPTPSATPDAADLRIAKSAQPDPVVAGQLLTYTIVVRNDGPAAAANVTIHDALPFSMIFSGTSHMRGPAESTKLLITTARLLTGTVSLLPVGRAITITALTYVSSGASGTTLANTANVTATNDHSPANNSVTLLSGLIGATATSSPTPTPTLTATVDPNATPTPTPTELTAPGGQNWLYLPLIQQ
jgi:uncharacterized repeat protein (TIGR01451 family)